MRFSPARLAPVLLLLALAALAPRGAQAQGTIAEVDVELVLAVDISRSMDLEELRIQRDGYVAALRDGEVIRAIEGGLLGRIAVRYFEWAGPGRRGIDSGWRLLDGPASAHAFADGLAEGRISAAVGTSISGAIDFALAAFEGNGFEGLRRVVDISGDGPNNAGRPVTAARDEAVAAGVVINGLPLMMKANDGPFSLRELDIYYEDCVIGGPLSFVLPLWEQAKFPETIRRKLILEIAAPHSVPVPAIRAPARPAAIPAQLGLGGQARAPRIDCLIGEKRRQRWMEGGGWEW
ncbi:DUF1194 domain-containing protein [Albimonas pacifica]|uniref:DUF1194 domain-containing protein n=1 Tax=Albimonas pacifica TaxID=1114924 RepID=A0A1I3N1J5_9RHOB|nr:DUF1194 domain-containing protein [Albimonas pacifica]SFJ03097.1 Protein of unknown function [Albimonas pacifica]